MQPYPLWTRLSTAMSRANVRALMRAASAHLLSASLFHSGSPEDIAASRRPGALRRARDPRGRGITDHNFRRRAARPNPIADLLAALQLISAAAALFGQCLSLHFDRAAKILLPGFIRPIRTMRHGSKKIRRSQS